MRLIARVVGTGAVLALLVMFTPLAWYIAEPLLQPDDAQPADAIVLFSSGQIDARYLTPDAAQRVLGALDLYRRGLAPIIVPSGSQHARNLFQAEAAAAWLATAGVPPEAIQPETGSTRTYESVIAVRAIMQARGWTRVVIVTSAFDVARIRAICAKAGVAATFLGVPEARPPTPGTLIYWNGYPVLFHAAYEYAAMALYRFKGWL